MTKFRPIMTALAISMIGLLLVLSRIDCGGTYPTLEGPGLTLDEVYNVEQGVYLTVAAKELGWTLFTFSGAQQAFGDKTAYNPDHPPIGRLLLGLAHNAVTQFLPSESGSAVTIAAGRVGSAVAFAATLFLITFFVAHRVNLIAGVASGAALLMMPRVVGHAHLGSLETMVGFFYTAAILAAGRTADKGSRSSTGRLIVAGVLIAVAMLTKIQGVFLPAAVIGWMLLTRKFGGLRSSFIVAITVAVFFVALWPWLWLDPIEHVGDYLGRTTDRQTVYNYYLGDRFAAPATNDVPATPWNYTLVMFLTTVPVGLHMFGFAGAMGALKRQLSEWQGAVLFGIAVPLVAFSTIAPVYDGARLFLIVYPLWAILIGIAFSAGLDFARKKSRFLPVVLIVGFASQCVGTLTTAPFYLSYYNFAVGGTAGADELGFERSYWGEATTKSFWDQVPEGSTVYVAPVLDNYRLQSLKKYSPIIQQRNITLEPFYYDLTKQPGLILILHR
ncbi:MAG: ArnT family glycosyltransferase, partial [Planctomycetaceae bacterium]